MNSYNWSNMSKFPSNIRLLQRSRLMRLKWNSAKIGLFTCLYPEFKKNSLCFTAHQADVRGPQVENCCSKLSTKQLCWTNDNNWLTSSNYLPCISVQTNCLHNFPGIWYVILRLKPLVEDKVSAYSLTYTKTRSTSAYTFWHHYLLLIMQMRHMQTRIRQWQYYKNCITQSNNKHHSTINNYPHTNTHTVTQIPLHKQQKPCKMCIKKTIMVLHVYKNSTSNIIQLISSQQFHVT